MDPRFRPFETPQETADKVAKTYFGVTDEASRVRVIRQSLISIVWISLLIPTAFYLRFRHIGPLGWGMTVFFDVYCLLVAIGLYFRPRTEYHTAVPLRGDWIDHVGAFWLVACAFGPFFGWIVTTGTFPITPGSWRWLFVLRVIFAAGVPVATALPLMRYIRGKASWVALPLLVGITLLPVSTAMNVSRDLWEGPVRQQLSNGASVLYLRHSERTLPDH